MRRLWRAPLSQPYCEYQYFPITFGANSSRVSCPLCCYDDCFWKSHLLTYVLRQRSGSKKPTRHHSREFNEPTAAVYDLRTDMFSRAQSKAAQEFLPYMWNSLEPVIPYSLQSQQNQQQFFEVAIMVFRQIDWPHSESLDLQNCISTWSDLLLRHVHREVSIKTHKQPLDAD